MKAIVILLDTLNRHFLPVHGNRAVKTPALDRLAEKTMIDTLVGSMERADTPPEQFERLGLATHDRAGVEQPRTL